MKQVEELLRIVCKVNCKRQFPGTYRRLNSLILNKFTYLFLNSITIQFLAILSEKENSREQLSKGGRNPV